MVILRPDADEYARATILDRISEIVTSGGGSMGRVDEWGKRRFAYEIDHMTEGFYFVLYFNAEVPTLDEVTRVLKIADVVVRHMPVRLDEPVAPVPVTVRAAALAPAAEAPAAEAPAVEAPAVEAPVAEAPAEASSAEAAEVTTETTPGEEPVPATAEEA